ncbi:two-component system response regulator QseB [Zavarzinia compransoris]|nr:two-component system response regulator QseB [Zavarzinia compransoris]
MIGNSLCAALADARMSVDWVRNGTDADLALDANTYAVVLLDLALPRKPGMKVLKEMRERGNGTPLIIISAQDDPANLVIGLDLGADDYLVKPFEIEELQARMRAVLRRHGGHATSVIGSDRIKLDLATAELSYNGKTVQLPTREFALMRALLHRPGAILSRHQLEEHVYGWGQEVESNAVEVLIHYVRRKFDKDIIRNIRGAGWMAAK